MLVENFAPGALDRMGFTWERIQEINPRLVYASVKGFGPGPYQECKVYEAVSARVAARGAWRKLLRTSPTTSCPSNPHPPVGAVVLFSVRIAFRHVFSYARLMTFGP